MEKANKQPETGVGAGEGVVGVGGGVGVKANKQPETGVGAAEIVVGVGAGEGVVGVGGGVGVGVGVEAGVGIGAAGGVAVGVEAAGADEERLVLPPINLADYVERFDYVNLEKEWNKKESQHLEDEEPSWVKAMDQFT